MPSNLTPSQECAAGIYGRDVLVSAAAGAGKTSTLITRIIRLLLQTDAQGMHHHSIERMLIVTFTRAAASELRTRISDALSAAINEHPEDLFLYHQLTALGKAHICTIDAFCLDVVKENFESLGLPGNFRLADSAELKPLYLREMKRACEKLYGEHSSVLQDDHPLNFLQGNDFSQVIDSILKKNGKEGCLEILLSLYNDLQYYPDGITLLRKNADRLEEACKNPIEQSAEYSELQAYVSTVMDECLARLDEIIPLCQKIPSFPQKIYDRLDSDREIYQQGRCLVSFLQHPTFDRWYSPQKNSSPEIIETAKIAQDVRNYAKERYNSLYYQVKLTVESLEDDMVLNQKANRVLYALFDSFDREMRQEKLRRGVLEFQDVRRYVLSLLLENGAPTALAQAYQAQFDEVYVDEYQDCDYLQDLLFRLIGKGKRFLVGDIKQSIYSFRGAQPSIFADYRRAFPPVTECTEPVGPAGGSSVYMSENFRCDKPIINFVNAVCGFAFQACRDSIGGYTDGIDSLIFPATKTCGPNDREPVHVVAFYNDKANEEDDSDADTEEEGEEAESKIDCETAYIACEINRLLAADLGYSPKDFTVISRSNKTLAGVATALDKCKIPTSAGMQKKLLFHPDTVMLGNLLSAIDNPRDDIPMMGLLSAPLWNIDFSTVLQMRAEKPDCFTLYDALCQAAQEEENTVISRFCHRLESWRKLASTLPVDRFIRKLYAEEELAPRATTPPFLFLYELARNYQNTSFCGLYQFLRYYRNLLKKPDDIHLDGLAAVGDAVQLMTIHHSKGLQNKVVFLIGAGTPFKDSASEKPAFHQDFGVAIKRFDSKNCVLLPTLGSRTLSLLSKRQSHLEEIRNLYVAMTRAEKRLYITGRFGRSSESSFRAKTDVAMRAYPLVILDANCYLFWILAAIADANRLPGDDGSYFDYRSLPYSAFTEKECTPLLTKPLEDSDADAKEAAASAETPVTDEGTPNAEEGSADATEDASDAGTPKVESTWNFYRRVLELPKVIDDPIARFRSLPTKAAASKLRADMLDSEWLPTAFTEAETDADTALPADGNSVADVIRHRIALMRKPIGTYDAFIDQSEQAGAAERGTAMHQFLQFCNFARLASTSPRQEIQALLADGFLSARLSRLLPEKRLQAFMESGLFSAICQSAHVYREVHFDRFMSYGALTGDDERKKLYTHPDYSLYVQGSIDLLLEDTAGELTLVDYKTDRFDASISEEEARQKLLAAHADQLRIYADATVDLFGKSPTHILIYSFSLNRSFDLTTDILLHS